MLTNRQISILQYLSTHKKPLFGKDIASSLGISSRTLRSEFQIINDFLKEYSIQIHSSPRDGYWLLDDDIIAIKKILTNCDSPSNLPSLPEERQIYLYFLLLNSDTYLTLEYLAEKLFTSKTTVSKEIHTMQEFVNGINGVKIEILKKKGVRITGDEQYIRKLVSGIIFFYHVQFMDYIQKTIKEFYTQFDKLDTLYYLLVDNFLSQNQVLSGPSIKLLVLEYFIIIQRISHNKDLTENLNSEKKDIPLPVEQINLLFNISLSDKDIICMQQLLRYKRFISSETQESKNEKMEEIANRYFQLLKTKYGFDFESSALLKDHIYAMLTYHHLTFRKRIALVEEIKNNYPYAYEIASEIVPIAEDVMDYHLLDNEISRFAVRVVIELDKIPQKKRTIILVDSPSYLELLCFKLKQSFSGKIVYVASMPAYQLNNYLQKRHSKIDLILSTSILSNPPDIDILYISPILNQNDINLLNDYFFRNNRSYKM